METFFYLVRVFVMLMDVRTRNRVNALSRLLCYEMDLQRNGSLPIPASEPERDRAGVTDAPLVYLLKLLRDHENGTVEANTVLGSKTGCVALLNQVFNILKNYDPNVGKIEIEVEEIGESYALDFGRDNVTMIDLLLRTWENFAVREIPN